MVLRRISKMYLKESAVYKTVEKALLKLSANELASLEVMILTSK